MAISDFFRSLSDPYFLKGVADEFSQLVAEVKEKGQTLAEEIDEIIHKENAFSFTHQATDEEMKTTVDLRNEAQEDFAAKHADLLKARGFTGGWENTAYEATECLEKLSDYLQKEEEENDFYLECMARLQKNFRRLPFRTPAQLADQANRLRSLLEAPALPEYQHPSSDQDSMFGLTEREARQGATKDYLDIVKGLCHEMDHEIGILKEKGPCFSPFVLEEQEQELLHSIVKLVFEKTGISRLADVGMLPPFGSFTRSRDLLSHAQLLQEKEQKILADLVVLSAALYLFISSILDGKPLEKQVIFDLQQAISVAEDRKGHVGTE